MTTILRNWAKYEKILIMKIIVITVSIIVVVAVIVITITIMICSFSMPCAVLYFYGQNLLAGGSNSDDDDDLDDDGTYTDEDDLRRKLSRLAGPGGALESESRVAPELLVPGGIASSLPSNEQHQQFYMGDGDVDELRREAAKDAVDLNEIYSDTRTAKRRFDGIGRGGVGGGRGGDGENLSSEENRNSNDDTDDLKNSVGEENSGSDDTDEWGTFDDEDWRGGGDGVEEDLGVDGLRPAGAGRGQDVPGLLGGERFGKPSHVEAGILGGESDGGEGG